MKSIYTDTSLEIIFVLICYNIIVKENSIILITLDITC